MGRVETTAVIPVPTEKIWLGFTDLGNYDKWLAIHTKWRGEVPAQLAKGVQYSEVITMLGMANVITWTVEEYEEGSRLKSSGTGMAGVKVSLSFEVEPEGDSSKISIVTEFSGNIIKGPLAKAVEKDGKKNLDASLAKLTELLTA